MSKSASRARCRSPLSSQKMPPSTSTDATGLTNITQRQPGPSVSRPPSSTPAAEARPPTAPQIPSALVRSEPSLKVVVRIESAEGSIIAAPAPCARRAAIRTPVLSAKPPIRDEMPISTVPATSTRRRPSRSAARPPKSMKPP